MALRSFRVATLAVMALLVIPAGNASADEGPVLPDVGTPPAEQLTPADTPAIPPATEPAVGAAAGDQGSIGEALSQDASQAPSTSEAAVTPPEASEPPDPSSSITPAPTAPSSGDQGHVAELPEPEGGAGDPAVEPGGQSFPAAPDTPIEATSALRTLAPGDGSPQALLSDVARELSSLGAEIDELQRLMDEGVAPPPSRLIRLRSRLERLAPTLLALQARLEASGRLSPLAQALLRRVRARLSRARVSTSGLIATLRQSGLPGPEVRLLLDELERFRAVGTALAATLHAIPATSGPGLGFPYLQPQPAPATARPYAVAAPAERPAATPRAGESPPGGGSDVPRPWSPAPMSAGAGPGSALLAAGLASLSALLIGLAAGRLGKRLRLPPDRRYMAMFLTPLDCPG
jgi:hypothetical protein